MAIPLIYLVLGLLLGSFANVYFHRLPRDLPLGFSRSACPRCASRISWFDNIPVISWLLLGGKCRSCGGRIPLRYPLVESATALLFFWVALRLEAQPPPAAAAFVFFYYILFLAGGIDLVTFFHFDREYGVIPDSLVILLAAGGVLSIPYNPLLASAPWSGAASALAAGAALLGFRWIAGKVLGRESLGLGDIKLVSAIGFWLGWKGILLTLFAGSLAGLLVVGTLLALGRTDRRSAVPFGPFLAAGSLCGLFLV
ncbi:MAG: hypothetical protein A2902_00335 [Elusimicrobia bacterium RIFCSPLOWO2_01_FULL_64_13]|nr:MAG: hypothetical protein A2636_02930 [Elusimicrobia bacterium RIFCSPHIGHO2_01_FULL_64_10]OGR98024.1 MAG: hypothetical protein A2902_00335 [Elusimicrobia bacterium RIFCSPLOWO2_01_FULL_64_13]